MGRTKKELGLDSMGIQKSMRLTDYLGDGIGQLPLNIMSSLVGQLTYFYTEKVGLAAGMVATMLLIAKIFDAFSDLAMGKIMDAGRSPKGKCRPWFSRMAIPALVAIILLFTVPKNIGSGFQTAYVLITNVLITAIVYTAVAIPYGALMAIRTESFEERGEMGNLPYSIRIHCRNGNCHPSYPYHKYAWRNTECMDQGSCGLWSHLHAFIDDSL